MAVPSATVCVIETASVHCEAAPDNVYSVPAGKNVDCSAVEADATSYVKAAGDLWIKISRLRGPYSEQRDANDRLKSLTFNTGKGTAIISDDNGDGRPDFLRVTLPVSAGKVDSVIVEFSFKVFTGEPSPWIERLFRSS